MSTFARDYSFGLTLSIMGHVALVVVLGMRLISLPAPKVQQVPLAIEATLIDTSAIRQREEEQRQREDEQRQSEVAEQQRKAKLEQQRQAAADEKRRQEDTKRKKEEAAERKKEQAIIDQKRKVEAERKEAEKRKVEDKRRREEEARVAEQKRKEQIERERREAEQKRQAAERQAEFNRELEAEEQRLSAIASGKMAQYIALIQDQVERNWARPASATAGIACDVHVTQIPGGEIVSVRVGSCNGDASVVRSIIAAVEKSSPLRQPADPTLFERNLRFTFKPEE